MAQKLFKATEGEVISEDGTAHDLLIAMDEEKVVKHQKISRAHST